jgi:hypothetical protein
VTDGDYTDTRTHVDELISINIGDDCAMGVIDVNREGSANTTRNLG